MKKELRRNVLKGIVVGMPAVWSAPVIKTAILPAHAATSHGATPCSGCEGASINTTAVPDVVSNQDDFEGENGLNLDGVETYIFDDGGTYNTSIGNSVTVWVRNGTTLNHRFGSNVSFYVDACSTLNLHIGNQNQIYFEPGASINFTGDGENVTTQTCVTYSQ